MACRTGLGGSDGRSEVEWGAGCLALSTAGGRLNPRKRAAPLLVTTEAGIEKAAGEEEEVAPFFCSFLFSS